MWQGLEGKVSNSQQPREQRTPQQLNYAAHQSDVSGQRGPWAGLAATGASAGLQYTSQSAGGTGLMLPQYLPAGYAFVPSTTIGTHSGLHAAAAVPHVQQQTAQLSMGLAGQPFGSLQQTFAAPHGLAAQQLHTAQQQSLQQWMPQQAQQTWALQQQQQQQQASSAAQLQVAQQQQQQQLQQQQQQQQQQLQQQQQQQLQQQLQQQAAASQLLLGQQHQPAGRGWGGQNLPYALRQRAGTPEGGSGAAGGPNSSSSRGGGRGGRRGGGGRGGYQQQGYGGGGGGFGGPGGGAVHTDALVQQLFAAVRSLPRGAPVHEAVAGGLAALDGRAAASLMKQLVTSGLAAQAWQLFEWLRGLDPSHKLSRLLDVYLYTAMVSACSGGSSRREVDVALALSREMAARGVPRNVHTFSALMNVCIKAGQYQAALEVWRELQDARCRPNVVTYNTLIDVYGKTGQWAEALKVLARMKEEGMEPVTRTYNTLMIACNSCNQWHEALSVYSQLLGAGHVPNTTTYNALITAYSKAGRLEKVMETLREMEAAGCERTVITFSALISACERDGQWELALKLFAQMLREGCAPNIITYNSLITALAAGGQWERAADVFSQLQRQGCEPDVVTYTALINAYEKGGQWRLALKTFRRMLQQGCRTDHVVFGAIVDALWDSGVLLAQARGAAVYRAAMRAGLLRTGAAGAAGGGGGGGPAAAAAAAASHLSGAAAGALAAGAGPSASAGEGGGSGDAGGAAAAGAVGVAAGAVGVAGGGGAVHDVQLGAHASGSAVVGFFQLLADLRERALTSGVDDLPSVVVLRFARARMARDGSGQLSPLLPLRDALQAWLTTHGSPFRPVHDTASAMAPRLEALGRDLGTWLLSDVAGRALLPYFIGVDPAGPTGHQQAHGPAGQAGLASIAAALVGSDEESAADSVEENLCREAVLQVRHFEATHCLSVPTMGQAYVAQRRELAADVLRVAHALRLPREAAHDAVLLLDRLMSVAAKLREDLLVMASATALRITAAAAAAALGAGAAGGAAARGASQAEAEAELDAQLSQVTGLPTLGLRSMELNVNSALGGDTAAISAMRCLRLYLRRMGPGPGAAAAPEPDAALCALMDAALLDPEFLNYRPSATAAAALYCHRLRTGTMPPWPASVALLTGYTALEADPELAAAVSAMQRVLLEVPMPRGPLDDADSDQPPQHAGAGSGDGGGSGSAGGGVAASAAAVAAVTAQMAALLNAAAEREADAGGVQ